ncbi:MAG TPA: hypothetical protein PLZ51_05690, partial [Aggregatilineales bacterium]|nr:hypothetical protein [Aggregatilineales bacterium]
LVVDAQAFMAQFDMAELETLDDAYIEDGLMDATTTILEFYVPATDSYKTIEVYGYDNPDSIDALITIIYDFAETPHEDAVQWTPQYVFLHIVSVEGFNRIDERAVLDVEHAFLFDEALVAVELKSPEELLEGVDLILDYQIAAEKLLPLLTSDIMYIRTAPNRVWRYWAEIVPYMP